MIAVNMTRRAWDSEYIRSVIGDARVEVMDGRNADRRYEANSESHRTTTPFSNYIDFVSTAWGNNSYLVANNHILERVAAV